MISLYFYSVRSLHTLVKDDNWLSHRKFRDKICNSCDCHDAKQWRMWLQI